MQKIKMTTLTDLSEVHPKITGNSQNWWHCCEDPKTQSNYPLALLLAKIYITWLLV